MRKAAPLAAAAAVFAALTVAASPAHASTLAVTTTRTYAADTVTVTWYENGVFTLARRIAIAGPAAVTTDRYESTYCTAVERGPGGPPPIVWSPPSGIRTQCAPFVDVNGVHLRPPSQDAASAPPTWVPFP